MSLVFCFLGLSSFVLILLNASEALLMFDPKRVLRYAFLSEGTEVLLSLEILTLDGSKVLHKYLCP